MSQYVEPVDIRNQLYDFLSNHSTLTEVATWSKSMLHVVPEEVDSGELEFPIAAVCFTYQWSTQESAAYYVGNVDKRVVSLWVCVSCKSEEDATDVEVTEQAVEIANLIGLALRSRDGRCLLYGGNSAAENVEVPEQRIRVVRKSIKNLSYWYSGVYVKVNVVNSRTMIS